jgi:hypothetical protein
MAKKTPAAVLAAKINRKGVIAGAIIAGGFGLITTGILFNKKQSPAVETKGNGSPVLQLQGSNSVSMPIQSATYNISGGNNQIGNSNTMIIGGGGDIKTNKDFQTLEAELQDALGQLKAVNQELIKTRNATSPRRISEKQRRNVITLLSDSKVSKIFLPVVVGNIDSETENFSGQFREMLSAAGYGKDAPLSLPPPQQNIMWVTNAIVAGIPATGKNAFEDVIQRPGLCPFSPTNNDVDVLALIDTNTFSPSIPASLMVFKDVHHPDDPSRGVFAFHPTNDPNAIALGVCQALIEEGISVGFMPANGILPDGQTGFFIPQKFY